MTEYALLVLPSTNRVYGQAAPALAAAELAALSQLSLGGRVTDVGELMLAGVPYVRFRSSDPLSPAELTVVSNLSSLYALFEVDGDALRPVTITPLAHWDDDLITIQRYAGKTNEQFTHLLLNLAVALVDGWTQKLRVLDPVCGRGTTLNQAVRYGYDAVGIDVDGRDIDAFTTFFTTWLQDKRIRHETDRSRHRVRVRFAASKADLKAGRGAAWLAGRAPAGRGHRAVVQHTHLGRDRGAGRARHCRVLAHRLRRQGQLRAPRRSGDRARPRHRPAVKPSR